MRITKWFTFLLIMAGATLSQANVLYTLTLSAPVKTYILWAGPAHPSDPFLSTPYIDVQGTLTNNGTSPIWFVFDQPPRVNFGAGAVPFPSWAGTAGLPLEPPFDFSRAGFSGPDYPKQANPIPVGATWTGTIFRLWLNQIRLDNPNGDVVTGTVVMEMTTDGSTYDDNVSPPLLTLTIVPEPASLGLLSLAGLALLRRRRRA